MLDLETLNWDIKEFQQWKKGVQEYFGKEKLNLEDLKNWNINKFLNPLN